MGLFDKPTPPPTEKEQRIAAARARLTHLENTIRDRMQHFITCGEALAAIRDEQLYRLSHATFADYVETRWGMTARRAYQLITGATTAAAVVAERATPGETLTEKVDALPAEAQASITAALNGRAPKRKSKAKRKPKPLRIKVPRGIIIIERKTLGDDPAELLRHALAMLTRPAVDSDSAEAA